MAKPKRCSWEPSWQQQPVLLEAGLWAGTRGLKMASGRAWRPGHSKEPQTKREGIRSEPQRPNGPASSHPPGPG